jgi:solute carrier family 25 (mitochondrial thiamine pyrophosphate transporter), member 19
LAITIISNVDKGFWRGNVPAELLYVTYGATQFVGYRSISTLLAPTSLPPSITSFVSGAAAGAFATATTYPLDLLRTRFAAQGTQKVYRSLVGSIADIARKEGFKGFFHGLGTGIGQIIPYMGIFFSVYEAFRPKAKDLQLPLGSGDALAGTFASIVAKTGVFPLDLIRKRLQVQGPARRMLAGGQVPVYEKGAFRVAKAVISREGWRGLYKGLGVSLIKAAPASAVTMWSYETVLSVLMEKEVLK